MKGAIICGFHDFERNTEKRHFHRGLKNMKVCTFFTEKRSGESCFSKKITFCTILRSMEMACALFFDILLVFTRSCCLSGGMTVLMLEITIISSKFSGQI